MCVAVPPREIMRQDTQSCSPTLDSRQLLEERFIPWLMFRRIRGNVSTRPSSPQQLSARLYRNSEIVQFERLVDTGRNHNPLVFRHAVIARLR
jgi:hypothetical protein